MSKIRIAHIHTDSKFIFDTKRFIGDDFLNELIFIGDKSVSSNDFDMINNFSSSLKDINTIIKICDSTQVVVLYDLNFIKSYIANRLSSKVIILWRFFGLELYSKIPNLMFSEETKKKLSIKSKIKNRFIKTKFFFDFLKGTFKYRNVYFDEFDRAAFKRVDFFLGISNIEYDFLKKHFDNLPRFLQISFDKRVELNLIKNQSNTIVIGNNRSPYNNHIDILNIINKFEGKSGYSFLMLLNYGAKDSYFDKLISLANSISDVLLVDTFMPLVEFNLIYEKADALIINSYRQMAMGNIFQALKLNVKVYLNKKNMIYNWLLGQGFLVFSFDEFCCDILSKNIVLTNEQIKINQHNFIKFSKKHNQDVFQLEIKKTLGLS